MAMIYFALGDGAKEIAQKNFGDYYGFLGEFAQNVVRLGRPRRGRASRAT